MASRAGRGTDPYKAVPLKAGNGNEPHIRLVKIHRDSTQSSLVHCHFVAYPLAACPPYTALSYTWNCSSSSSASSLSSSSSSADDNNSSSNNTTTKEAPTQTILLQSTRYTIGQNLYAFLRRVRRDSHDRLYWIDALCINQNDNDERSHQVRLMRDIYSSAARVIVWLGEATSDNYATIHLLEAAYRGDCSSSGGFGRNGSSTSLSNSNSNGSPASSPKIGSSPEISLSATDKQHIASLYEHEYWSRVWIVQEVICARELVVYWGKRTIRWECIAAHVCGPEDFNDSVAAANNNNNNNSKSSTTTAPTTVLQRMLASTPAAIIIRTKAAWDGAVPLAQLVTTYRHLRSSDVRDKVFGLLGLASDKREIDEDDEIMQQTTNYDMDDSDDAMKDPSPDEEDDDGGSDANTIINNNNCNNGMIPALQADYSMTPEDVFEASCRVAFRSHFLGNHYDRMQFGRALREALAVPFTDRRLDELARQVVGLPLKMRQGRGQRRNQRNHGGAKQYNLRKQQKIYRMHQWQQQQQHDEHRKKQKQRRQWMPPLRSDSSLASSAASASLSKKQANAARSRVRDRTVKRTERTGRYLLRGPSLHEERSFGMSGLNLSDEMAE